MCSRIGFGYRNTSGAAVAKTAAARGEPSSCIACRTARHSAISSVPSNCGSIRPADSSGRPASSAAMAVSALVSGEAASFGSESAAMCSRPSASAPRPSARKLSAALRLLEAPGHRRRRGRIVDLRDPPTAAAHRPAWWRNSAAASDAPHPSGHPWRLSAATARGRPAGPVRLNPVGACFSAMVSESGSTTTPCIVGRRTNSVPRRLVATPWPDRCWVPTNSVAPVSGSARLTTSLGCSAARLMWPSSDRWHDDRLSASGVLVSAAMRQPCGICVSAIDRSGGSGIRSRVPLGNSRTERRAEHRIILQRGHVHRPPFIKHDVCAVAALERSGSGCAAERHEEGGSVHFLREPSSARSQPDRTFVFR